MGNSIGGVTVNLTAKTDAFTQGMKKASKEVKDLSGNTKGLGSSFASMSAFTRGFTDKFFAAQVAIKSVGAAFQFAAGNAIAYEQAFVNVKKTVDGTDTQLQGISDELRKMSRDMPQSAEDLANIAAEAGQLGISRNNIAEFTKTIADLGVSTKLVGEEGATEIAKFLNITGLSQSKVRNLASALAYLDMASASNAKDIMYMSRNLAGAGNAIGLTAPQILAVSSALSSVGIEAEAGGTAFSKVFMKIKNAAMDGGESLTIFSDIAKMSGDEFSKTFKRDPSEVVAKFMAGFKELARSGKSLTGVFDDMDLIDARLMRSMINLGNGAVNVGEEMKNATKQFEDNVALTKSSEKYYATSANQLEALKNNWKELSTSFGENAFITASKALFIQLGNSAVDAARNFLEFTDAEMALKNEVDDANVSLEKQKTILTDIAESGKAAWIWMTENLPKKTPEEMGYGQLPQLGGLGKIPTTPETEAEARRRETLDRRTRNFKQQAESWKSSTRTDEEQFAAQMKEINTLSKKGFMDQDTYARAKKKIEDEYYDKLAKTADVTERFSESAESAADFLGQIGSANEIDPGAMKSSRILSMGGGFSEGGGGLPYFFGNSMGMRDTFGGAASPDPFGKFGGFSRSESYGGMMGGNPYDDQFGSYGGRSSSDSKIDQTNAFLQMLVSIAQNGQRVKFDDDVVQQGAM